ncbi:alpha-amylase [Salinimonas sp. HHU 13199]|uniref:Alpha-amylase n=1 Tax=Salinimonas profundi TaxID=2729140 RepID=A0ABR8LFR6_9ALTE|nr:alpha-amylase family protein [Salinimonas profundi]MBD3584572.1 alpha-amylase [Salinimonas profundi]
MNLRLRQHVPVALALISGLVMMACSTSHSADYPSESSDSRYPEQQKPVVYQAFTRLFGNKNSTNKPWGSMKENGVGKFADFSDKALSEIRALGVSHIWYTGVPHHATSTDYTQYSISLDDPDVIKGRAGSPYAVKDYYNVDPDLATDPAFRMQEFESLVKRTHANGMKVIIDIVPNHVARDYSPFKLPNGITALGEGDDTSVAYHRDNNFYYVPGSSFDVPAHSASFDPMGGAEHPLADGKFDESPAKWTGNGARSAQPDVNDWYETVKINYGVRPDGSYDFPALPADYATKPIDAHFAFWQDKSLPDSWYKMRDIALFWLDKGVDGFRFDMAEMVPVEFWSFLNASIKHENPDAFLLAEVYQPDRYRDYLHLGKMDYLYDKVGLYDSIKDVMQGSKDVSVIDNATNEVSDIADSMLHFLENHDEQRIASAPFAGNAERGKPALVVSALNSRAPFMLYFGQEVGEDGSEETGFGDPSRTTIFDYAGVPAHQRWMNEGAFDGGQLTAKEQALRTYYQHVLTIAAFHPAMQGGFQSLQQFIRTASDENSTYSFMRTLDKAPLVVISHFGDDTVTGAVDIPRRLFSDSVVASGINMVDLLNNEPVATRVDNGVISIKFSLAKNQSLILSTSAMK